MSDKKRFMTKHLMFGAPNLSQSKKITQPLVVIVETFRMSGVRKRYYVVI